ncbi:hypothetical protein LTR06_001579 [Exophiala xenobiotica]|nr:hypothetical protein LTR06_001579 [Exophiala xenobiotica]
MSTTPAPSPTRLRQIALIAQDIERAKYLLTTILGTEVVYIDPQVAQWGIKNFLGKKPNPIHPHPHTRPPIATYNYKYSEPDTQRAIQSPSAETSSKSAPPSNPARTPQSAAFSRNAATAAT